LLIPGKTGGERLAAHYSGKRAISSVIEAKWRCPTRVLFGETKKIVNDPSASDSQQKNP
jgi:hypothetical protein